MVSGISRSLEKDEFIKGILKDCVVRCSYDKHEYFIQYNIFKRKHKNEIRQSFRRTGKAPAIFCCYEEPIYSKEKPNKLVKKK